MLKIKKKEKKEEASMQHLSTHFFSSQYRYYDITTNQNEIRRQNLSESVGAHLQRTDPGTEKIHSRLIRLVQLRTSRARA